MRNSNLKLILILLSIFIAIRIQEANRLTRGPNNYYEQQQQQQQQQQPLATGSRARPSREPLAEFLAQQGGPVRNLTLGRHLNPIIIRNDIVIKRDAKLTIEAGAELYFEPRRGIIVQGVLEILGQPSDKVRLQLIRGANSQTGLVRAQLVSASKQQLPRRTRPQVRLVDGDLPNEGRVQIRLNDRWHSLCTQSTKNLTASDIGVLCRQAGYQPGHWYRWFPGRHNSTTTAAAWAQFAPQAMIRSFHCHGNESQLQLCPRWNRLRVGGGVCDNQFDLGIRCSRKLAPDLTSSANVTMRYWRGIEFQEAESQQEYILEGQMKRRVSKSLLQHLVITEAGLDEALNGTAAIRVYGQPPRMSHLQVSHSMYGIWMHDVQDAVQMDNIKLSDNMAAPMFINSSHGKVQLDRLEVVHNGGDAIRLVRHERPLVGSHDFCKFANLGTDQTYPVVLSHEQQFLRAGHDCCQEFISQQQQLTVHFPVLRSTPNNLLPETAGSLGASLALNEAIASSAAAVAGGGQSSLAGQLQSGRQLVSVPAGVRLGHDAQLVIYDDYREDSPFKLTIRNQTRAQSIVSKAGRLKICYEPASFRTVLFTIEVVADEIEGDDQRHYEQNTGIAHDLELSNSLLDDNEGRGVWLDNLRSGLLLFNTTISQHQHLAGLHAENGTGEVIISASRISNNTGHGVYLQLAGGYYHIDNSTLSDNSARAISIEPDSRAELVAFNHTFHLGYSLISRNGQQGLYLGNVCRSDAFWNVSMNTFSGNLDDAVHFESCPGTHFNVQHFSSMTSRIGSTTMSGEPNQTKLQELHITHNVFLDNQRRAIRLAPVHFVRAYVRHNLFRGHPLAVLYVSNRQAAAARQQQQQQQQQQQHQQQLLQESPAFDQDDANLNSSHLAPANIRVAWNRFQLNRGRYVAHLALDEDSLKQQLVFTKNQLEQNSIVEPYSDLKPRSRCSAVVVVGSSQVKVIRNRLDNPQSTYELGVHLEAHSKVINATANYWGSQLDAGAIYRRIFDRKNRYNLAQVEFLQYLLSPEDLEYITDLSFDRERDKLVTFRNGSRLGGELKGYEELAAGVYTVQDDITILPGSHLVIRDGVTLKFGEGVGLMNQGRLEALGKLHSPIEFTSISSAARWPGRATTHTTTTAAPQASAWVSQNEDLLDSLELSDELQVGGFNRSSGGQRRAHRRPRQSTGGGGGGSSQANVRLSHTTMGKLEVQIDGVWGPVCDYNFDIDDAAVACQQMGMILNRDDWLLERFQYMQPGENLYDPYNVESTLFNSGPGGGGGGGTPAAALMTNVRCDPTLDTDITSCQAEFSLRGDFDGVCNSEVGIRCFPSSWSGVRFGMGAETSTLEHVTIQRAGMYDYAKYSLRPALQIDFNRHWLNWLTVKSNSDSGLGIMFNDVIGRHFSELAVNEGKFLNNERHGIELRSRGLTIRGCQMANNRQNGLDYNPSMSLAEMDDLLSWLRTTKNAQSVVTLNFPLRQSVFNVPSSEDSYRFFVIPRAPPTDVSESFTIGTDPGHMLSIQLLSPLHWASTEQLNMSLSLNSDGSAQVWDLRVNLTSLPMVSPRYKFHLNYSSGARPLGNVVLYVRSRYNNRDSKVLTKFIPAHLIAPKFDQTATNINSRLINSLVLVNNTLFRNGIGLKFRHPNHSFDSQRRAHNFRFANETTNITNNSFEANYFSTIYVGSDDNEEQLVAAAGESAGNTQRPVAGAAAAAGLMTASAEICYNLLGNKMRRNKDGIRQFSRDWRRSNNLFHWQVNETLFEANKAGGINLMLPYYWPYDANASHSVELFNNSFVRNGNYEFNIEGHFSLVQVLSNRWRENRCRQREALISFRDMEKQLTFRHNQIEANSCNKLVDFNIHSHADKLGSIASYFEFNSLRQNRRLVSNSTWSQWSATFSRWPRLIERLHPTATDYALGLRGIQLFNISRNLFSGNELRFDLVAAINLNPNEMKLNASENFWGSSRASDISERIFDFDDWNNYALVEFSPFLVSDSFQAASMLADRQVSGEAFGPQQHQQQATQSSDLTARLGGRLMGSMTLRTRKEPYLVEADLTVMPNVRLTIERGATLLFMPNVGLLVLGELVAGGTREQPIQMRPLLGPADLAPLSSYLFPSRARPNITQAGLGDAHAYEHNYAFKHYAFTYPVDMGAVRLCKNEICNDGAHIYENNVEDSLLRQQVLQAADPAGWRLDGFLEVFNMSTLQWVPVCDPLFSEHAARVVCRQLGYSHLSLLKRGRRYTLEQEQTISIKSWHRSIQCEGDELNLSSCPLAAASFSNHTTRCQHDSNQFVYVYCRDFPEMSASASSTSQLGQLNFDQLDQQSAPAATQASRRASGAAGEHLNRWGGLTFACPQGAQTPGHAAASSQSSSQSSRSRLNFVHIDRAGLLHRRRAPALQIIQCPVQLEHVSITNSAHHGLELVAPQTAVTLHQLRVRNSLGLGLNYLSLTGSSSQARHVPYLPLKQAELPSEQMFGGLIDVCGPSKELRVDERLLLVFRYQSRPVDCVKIISSKLSVKHLGLRMLQFNLFNSSQLTPRPDSVRLYDGGLYDWDSRLMVEFGVEERHRIERPELRFYQTTDSTMTIRLHASGADPKFGFIAEVVTTPVSYTLQRLVYNNVTFSELSGNKLGAMSVATAGESTSNLILRNNRFESNCLHLFGNFTSCTTALHMELQNCPHLLISNNLFRNNQAGGLMLKSFSHSAVASLEAQIERNVFESNSNTWALALVGPKSDPYQRATLVGNYITRNVAWHLPNVLIARMVANFSQNILVSNVGKHQIETVGFDRVPLTYQTFLANWIYNNSATFERDRSTIVCNSAGQQFHANYLVNPDNFNELSAGNWSRYDVRPHQVARDDEIIHLVAGDGSSKELLRKNVETIPLSVIDTKRLDLHQATVQAELNWWGFNTSSAIQNRVRDRLQHEELIRVQFTPYLDTNQTLLDGVCSGGWQRVNGVCLVYIGTRMSYAEAREFCEREHATLPLLRGHVFSGNHYEFTGFVARQHEATTRAFATRDGQQVVVLGGGGGRIGADASGDGELGHYAGLSQFDAQVERVWVRSFEVSRNACPALNDFRTRFFDCQERHAFLCEKDPQVVVTMISWWRETGGVLAVLLGLITLLITCCLSACWLYKSRERHREKLQRKSSLHASMRSLRMATGSQASLNHGHNQSRSASDNSLSELFLHRQLYNTPGGDASTKSNSITDLSMSTQWTQPSNDEANLVRLDPGGGGQVKPSRRQRSRSSTRSEYDPEKTYKLPVTASYTSQVSLTRDSLDRAIGGGSPRARGFVPNGATTTSSIRPRPQAKRSASRTPSLTDSYNFEPLGHQEQQVAEPSRQRYSNRKFQAARGALGHSTRSFVSPSQTPDRPNFDYQQLPPPPPELSYHYSNIRFDPDPDTATTRSGRNGSGGSPADSHTQLQASRQAPINLENLYAAKPVRIGLDPMEDRQVVDQGDLNSSSSTTFMSNRTFEESTNSYLETYQLYSDGFGPNQMNPINNADQISVVLTERSSVTDSIVNTRVTESQLEYRWLSSLANEPLASSSAIYQNQLDLNPMPDPERVAAPLQQQQQQQRRAASDMGAAGPNWPPPLINTTGAMRRSSQGNLMETSLDLELEQAAAAVAIGSTGNQFGGSQPLVSPAAFGEAGSQAVDLQQSDSKSGSRVYLETSFE